MSSELALKYSLLTVFLQIVGINWYPQFLSPLHPKDVSNTLPPVYSGCVGIRSLYP